MRSPTRTRLAVLLAAVLTLVVSACGGDDDGDEAEPAGTLGPTAGGDTPEPVSSEPVTVRLGYFPNVTHAPAIIGHRGGFFEDALGDNVTLEVSHFNAGGEAVEAIFSGALDATFIGPNPAINAYARDRDAIRIVAGTASGGAYLVVNDDINAPEDLAGRTLSSPALGNTQDVALRAWLLEQGYETDTAGGGDVSILPQENSQILTTFIDGSIDGAWVPEPWATRLVDEGGGKVLVDEAELWPDGEYVTTHLIVTKEFLDEHPDVVRQLIEGLAAALDVIQGDRDEAESLTARGIEEVTGKPIAPDLVTASFDNLAFTLDPIASSLTTSAENATALGLLDPVDLDGIYDLSLLNEVLADRGDPEVSDT